MANEILLGYAPARMADGKLHYSTPFRVDKTHFPTRDAISGYRNLSPLDSLGAAWKRCAHCQKLIRSKNLKDEDGLQSYFIQRIEKHLNAKGKRIIGWDEILEGGLAPNATVMSWRGEDGGIAAASDGHDVIMTPTGWMYFDYAQSDNDDSLTIGNFIPLKKVYEYRPVPAQLDASKAKHVLGAQANVWSEIMTSPAKVEQMIFPRLSALSEVLWTPEKRKSWNRFKSSLPVIYERYELWGANYFKKTNQVSANQ